MGAELAREAFSGLKGLFAGKLRSHKGWVAAGRNQIGQVTPVPRIPQ